MTTTDSTRRLGISLLETIACLAIVATMATSMVSMMSSSARMAEASRCEAGAPAQARAALRRLSDQIRDWDRTSGIQRVRAQSIDTSLTPLVRHRFLKRRSTHGGGHDLVLQYSDGTETILVFNDHNQLSLTPILDGTNLLGVEMRLQLRRTGSRTEGMRGGDLQADVRTQICFSPQLKPAP